MTLSHFNHIHLQYCYRLYKFMQNLIIPGGLENYVLHNNDFNFDRKFFTPSIYTYVH